MQPIGRLSGYEILNHAHKTGRQFGALTREFWSSPVFGKCPSAVPAMFAACGELAERSCSRINAIPEWDIKLEGPDGRELPVQRTVVSAKPFCNLVRFETGSREAPERQVLLVPPMSGHHPTLVRKTVASLLPRCDVFVTEWKNARDVPVSEGSFDIEDFVLYLVDFIRQLGRNTHVLAVCQPAPAALAATAFLAQAEPAAQPLSLVLMGGPIIPDAAPTDVTAFGNRVTQGQLEHFMVQRVSAGHAGEGRLVFPGSIQLSSFMSMNPELHYSAFVRQFGRIAKGIANGDDRHNRFYDEYLAVMDLPAEFYLSTVNRVFKDSEFARNCFSLKGQPVDLRKISATGVLTIEGGRDDIAAPGQSSAVLPMLSGIPDNMKAMHVEPDAGHYGIFSGSAWRNSILPVVLNFIDARLSDIRAA